MPESKRRKKAAQTSSAQASAPKVKQVREGNPVWLVPTMITMFIVGILWVVLFYLTSGGAQLPIPPIGRWNILVGFMILLTGFGLSTRWK